MIKWLTKQTQHNNIIIVFQTLKEETPLLHHVPFGLGKIAMNSSMLFNWIPSVSASQIEVGLLAAVVLALVFLFVLSCHCCQRACGSSGKYERQFEKTVDSMRNNFVYVAMGGEGEVGSDFAGSVDSRRGLLEAGGPKARLFDNRNAIEFLEEDPDWEFPRDK